MSTSYNIFINTDEPFLEVKSSLEKILNCQMEKSPYAEWELYYAVILGIGIGLHKEHDFEDDFGIQFSQYEYFINFDYMPKSYQGEYRGEWEPSIARIIADMLSLNLHCECLVARNMSTVIDRFTISEQSK